jgi:hypothetical protein
VGGGGVNPVQPPPRPIPHLSISVQVVVLHLAVFVVHSGASRSSVSLSHALMLLATLASAATLALLFSCSANRSLLVSVFQLNVFLIILLFHSTMIPY